MEKKKEKSRSFLHYLYEMFEVALVLGIVVVASFYIPSSWVPSEFVFCLFFLAVFAIAIRYSCATAYTGSVLAGVSYSLFRYQRPVFYTHFDVRFVFFEAFLLLASGVLMYDLLHIQRRIFMMAKRQRAQQDTLLQETNRNYQMALEINAKLERQIAEQTTTVATISDKIGQLWQLKGKECYAGILDTVKHSLETPSCVLYMRQKGDMHFSVCQPADAYIHTPTLNLDDPLINGVLQQRQVRTIHDVLAHGQTPSRKVAVMAGPLLDEDKQIIGIVIVDQMSMLKFTPGAVRLFSAILHMASLVLQKALSEEEITQRMYRSSVPFCPTPVTPTVKIGCVK